MNQLLLRRRKQTFSIRCKRQCLDESGGAQVEVDMVRAEFTAGGAVDQKNAAVSGHHQPGVIRAERKDSARKFPLSGHPFRRYVPKACAARRHRKPLAVIAERECRRRAAQVRFQNGFSASEILDDDLVFARKSHKLAIRTEQRQPSGEGIFLFRR